MAPMQYDSDTTSPIDREELRALIRRVRDIAAQPAAPNASAGRAEDVVVHRAAVAAWLGARR